MSRESDADWENDDDFWCDSSSALSGRSPRRALDAPNFPRSRTRNDGRFDRTKINIPLNCEEDVDLEVASEIDTGCVSLQYKRRAPCAKPISVKARKPRCPARGPEPLEVSPPCRKPEGALVKQRKKLHPRQSPHQADECASGATVKVPCGVAVENYQQDFLAETWDDEDDCDSEYDSGNTIYRPDPLRRGVGKGCASDKRRNMLKSKLRELLSETEPIPESCLLENAESKPEPEVLAEVLLMSEAEGIDLAEVKPDNVFDNLFADMTFDRSITIANAAPESMMSDVVVPIQLPGQESTPFEIPDIDSVMEKTRGTLPPNLNAFRHSTGYETLSGHMNELLDRAPATENVSELLGSSITTEKEDGDQGPQNRMVDYIVKPGPSAHTNRIRLNGSTRPIWFPGYIFVSPAIQGCIRMTEDPGEALKEAWRLCQPRHFDERSRYLVDIG